VGCGFGYADISMQTGGIDRQSTYLSATYEVDANNSVYFESRYSKIASFGRYAPAVGFTGVGADNAFNPKGHAALGDVDGNGMLDDGRGIFIFHRFVGHGNRDDSLSTSEFDNVAGLKGNFNVAGGINYDVYLRHYEYLSQEEGDVYVIRSIIEDLISSGDYDFSNPLSQDQDHLAAVAQSSGTLFRDIKTEYDAFGLTVDGSFLELPAGQVGWAAGIERAHESYQDQYDSFREAGNVLGSAGNSSAGSRSRWAAFAEVQIPVLDNLEVNIAGRYDDYSDFGDEFSPQIAARWKAHEKVTVRASWGEGFKAPNLGDIGQELSQSFETVTDTTFCAANGIAAADCGDTQVEEFTGGNRSLAAEETESWNIGLVVSPINDLTFSLDYFSVKIDESVDTLDLQDVIDFEAAGTLPAGVSVGRGPTGIITRCAGADPLATGCGIVNVFANLAAEDIKGLDLRAQYDYDTSDWGSFMAALEYSKISDYDYQPTATAPVTKRPGTTAYPEFRYNVNLRWTWDDWTVNYTYRYIDEHEGVTAGSKYPEYDAMDLGVTWAAPWGGEIAFGALNLTDEDPSFDDVSGFDQEISLDLYDVSGRVPYLTYKHMF
jgi:iron complex outermembrane recepter protein